jgi:hypothetical protein
VSTASSSSLASTTPRRFSSISACQRSINGWRSRRVARACVRCYCSTLPLPNDDLNPCLRNAEERDLPQGLEPAEPQALTDLDEARFSQCQTESQCRTNESLIR